MRVAALIVTLVVALPPSTLRAQGEPRTFDLDELGRVAARRHVALSETILSAEQRDSTAIRDLISLAVDSAARANLAYPALLFAFLGRLGDHAFANLLRGLPDARRPVLAMLDRGAGFTYARQYPETWALGSHSSAMVPDTVTPPLDSTVEISRSTIYEPGSLSRRPGIVPHSCGSLPYPHDLERAGLSGRVVVELTLDTLGHLESEPVVISATHRALAERAQRSLSRCEFAPGRRRGWAVRSRVWVAFGLSPQVVEFERATFRVVTIGDVVAAAQATGVDFAFALARARGGDAAALDTTLALAVAFGGDSGAAASYQLAVGSLLEEVGDDPIAASLARLEPGARRAALEALADGVTTEGLRRFPEVSRLRAATPNPRRYEPPRAGPPGPELETYDEAVVEVRPELNQGSCHALRYPESLRESHIQGQVMLQFIIDTLGAVEPRSVRIARSSHPAFSAAALDVVLSCRYGPGRINGKAVRVRVQQPINFQLDR